MRDVSSAFYERLQRDGELAELIDLDTVSTGFRWTTANGPVTATLSSALTEYTPFPGGTGDGIEESSDLAVAVIDFMMANTGEVFQSLLINGEFAKADLRISRVFVDTPDLGRMPIYQGRIGDFSYNRLAITGQARNFWKGVATKWPHLAYQDTCGWRFGSPGCGFNTTSVTLQIGTADIVVSSSSVLTIRFADGFLTNSFPAGRFDFGRFTVSNGVNIGQVRTIRVQTGDQISLSHALGVPDLEHMAGAIFPGCRKRLVQDCHSLYNNTENFLGIPWAPIPENAFK